MFNLFELDPNAIESCKNVVITATTTTPPSGCTPYSYSWSVTSNSSTPQTALNTFITNVGNTATLTIPPGTLEFGIKYDFKVAIKNVNSVPLTPYPTINFTTLGGNTCQGPVTFPSFNINHNGKYCNSKNYLIRVSPHIQLLSHTLKSANRLTSRWLSTPSMAQVSATLFFGKSQLIPQIILKTLTRLVLWGVLQTSRFLAVLLLPERSILFKHL